MSDIPKSAWQRSRALMGLAAKLARKEVGGRLRSAVSKSAAADSLATRVEQAKLLAESFGRLKGAVMKAGQFLSLEAGDFLPPEVLTVLETLQANAEVVPFATMRAVLVSELGEAALARFSDFNEEPAASASIGQVYRAHVDGAPVAVKVQYPGVAESIDSDLAVLQKLGQFMVTTSGRRMKLDELTAELSRVLHWEADYERERGYLTQFATALKDDARFVVPRSYAELSTKRVLTMSWEEGVPLGKWLKSTHPRDARQALGVAMLDLFCIELFDIGVVQTDPNFANFLVRDDGRIVLLDFGASVPFDATFRRDYTAMLRAMASGSHDAIISSATAFGVIDARESSETMDHFVAMLRHAIIPFQPERQPFAFADTTYSTQVRVLGERFARSLVYSAPPKQLIFLHRKLGGLFELLKRLDVVLDLRPYLARLTA